MPNGIERTPRKGEWVRMQRPPDPFLWFGLGEPYWRYVHGKWFQVMELFGPTPREERDRKSEFHRYRFVIDLWRGGSNGNNWEISSGCWYIPEAIAEISETRPETV